MRLILDVSRLLYSFDRVAPTGIDRVEMAYARHLPRRVGTVFAAEGPWGFAALPARTVAALLDALESTWSAGAPPYADLKRAARLAAVAAARLAAGAGRRALLDAAAEPDAVLLIVSHRALDRAGRIAPVRDAGAAFVALVHDVIPLTHPEYARPAQAVRHARRVATVARLADGVIVNSAATAAALAPLLAAHGGTPPVVVAPLGVAAPRRASVPDVGAPYFAVVSTLEPRKNHLLILQLWRELAQRLGRAAPRLLLCGRQGWGSAPVLDFLRRCPSLDGLVELAGPINDADVAARLAGARALLFPSFAEGYGLPLAEALAAGVPALVSDLPALREVGGDVPEWLDPLDGAAWRAAVLDYAQPDSPRRAAQLRRLAHWRAPGWDAHFAAVEPLLARAAAARAAVRAGRPMMAPSALPGLAAG